MDLFDGSDAQGGEEVFAEQEDTGLSPGSDGGELLGSGGDEGGDPFAGADDAGAEDVAGAGALDDAGAFGAGAEEDSNAVLRSLALERRERAEEADAAERERMRERRGKALEALAQFNEERARLQEQRAAANRAHDQELMEELEAAKSAPNPWEAVAKLVDTAQEVQARTRDASVMRKLLIRLKNEPVLHNTAPAEA